MKEAIISLNREDTSLVDTSKMNVTQSKAFKESDGKKGIIRAAFITKKAFGEANNLKGAALAKAHDAYRLSRSQSMGGELCKAIAGGKIFPTAISRNAKGTGGTISYVHDLHATREIDASNAETKRMLNLLVKALGGQEKVDALLKEQAKSTAEAIIDTITTPVTTPEAVPAS